MTPVKKYYTVFESTFSFFKNYPILCSTLIYLKYLAFYTFVHKFSSINSSVKKRGKNMKEKYSMKFESTSTKFVKIYIFIFYEVSVKYSKG